MKEIIITYCALLSFLFGFSQTPADIDTSFFYSGGVAPANSSINSIAIQLDGKILIGGSFNSYNGTAKQNVARLNSDGSLDTSFLSTANNASSTQGTVNSIEVLNNGTIIMGGKFTSVNTGALRAYFAGLNSYGSISMTTYIDGLDNYVNCVAKNPNNNFYYIGGDFTHHISDYHGISQFNDVINGSVKAMVVQTDGKVLFGGSFLSVGSTTVNGFTRLNVDTLNGTYELASVDSTFNQGGAGVGAGSTINAIAIQSDGKILIAGTFGTYNGISRLGIARLNTNGTLDTSFDPITGINYNIYAIAVQTDGKILIGGMFTTYNGVSRKGIARLNSNGSLDTTFNPGLGMAGGNLLVKTIALQTDGKIIVGGDFTSYNGVTRNGIVRLYGDSALGIENQNSKQLNLYPNPANDKFTIDFGSQIISNYSIKINNLLGQEVYTAVIDKPQFEVYKTWQGQGLYFVKIYDVNNNLVTTRKIILQ